MKTKMTSLRESHHKSLKASIDKILSLQNKSENELSFHEQNLKNIIKGKVLTKDSDLASLKGKLHNLIDQALEDFGDFDGKRDISPTENEEWVDDPWSFLRSLRKNLRRGAGNFDLSYEDAVTFNMVVASYLLQLYIDNRKEGYLEFMDHFWKINPSKNNLEAEAEWKALLEITILDKVETFFRPYSSEDRISKIAKITLNSAIWSFTGRNIMPVHRKYLNMDSTEPDTAKVIKSREKSFIALREAQKYYSTIEEVVENGIQSGFYFDRQDSIYGKMVISEIDFDSKKVVLTQINGRHRENMHPKEKFSFESIERYLEERAKSPNLLEKQFQNQVLRWYIRAGLLNPEKVSIRGLKTTTDLLVDLNKSGPLYKTYKNQYKQNLKKNGDFSETENKELDLLINYLFGKNSKAIAARLYVFDTGFFNLTQQENYISHIYWAPLICGHPDQETGGVFYLNSDIRLHDPKERGGLANEVAIISYFLSGLFDDKQMQEITYQHNIERDNAAAVTIMSRNISHNIGSHTMSYEKHDLSDIKFMMHNGTLGNLFKKTADGLAYELQKEFLKTGTYYLDLDNSNLVLHYLQAKGHFDGYLQERHDYIGAVASGTQFYQGSVNLRHEILEYFLRISFDEREDGKYHYSSDNSQNRQKGNRCILLERIAKSEKYGREDIVFNYDESKAKKASLSLPTGLVGRQAFFTVLENVIRNTAKHGTSKNTRPEIRIDISIEASDDHPDYFKICVRDNSGDPASPERNLPKIKESLGNPLVRPDGKIDESQKGIKEIQIAAAWMRGIAPTDILKTHHARQPLKPVEIHFHKKFGKGGLEYVFYIRKEKRVAIVGMDEVFKHQNKLPRNWGYRNAKSLHSGEASRQFHFVLVDSHIKNQVTQGRLPVRAFIYDIKNIDFDRLVDEKYQAEVELAIYDAWLQTELMTDALVVDMNNVKIAIVDQEGRQSLMDEQQENSEVKICALDTRIRVNKNPETGKKEPDEHDFIVFRKHNDTSDEFNYFRGLDPEVEKDNPQINATLKANFKSFPFIEGISGNNATHRLIREEVHTPMWSRKIKESALSRFMLIDERIWKEVTSIDENDEESGQVDLELEYLKYAKKSIFIYTIEPRKKENSDEEILQLINTRNKVEAQVGEDGTIHWAKGYRKKFHFVSLHQGLYDKIAAKSTDKPAYFANFRKENNPSLRYYMHSGRSFNPDLPENTAFIPLSSLDAALRNCKFVLTSLLYAGIVKPEND